MMIPLQSFGWLAFLLSFLLWIGGTSVSTSKDDCPASFSAREELEAMMEKWLAANAHAEQVGNWSALADFYTEDAVYSWGMGHNKEFVARGRKEIREIALGWYMKGFERWSYPYYDVIIDDKRGVVVAFYHQVAPARRPNGETYQVDGISGSRFQYAGNYQWQRQTDFFDMGNVMALTLELAGAGELDTGVKEKVQQQVWGQSMPLVHSIRSSSDSTLTWWYDMVTQYLAMIKIIMLGA